MEEGCISGIKEQKCKSTEAGQLELKDQCDQYSGSHLKCASESSRRLVATDFWAPTP